MWITAIRLWTITFSLLMLTAVPSSCDPVSLSIGFASAAAFAASWFYSGTDLVKCQFYECCNNKWIQPNESALSSSMSTRFYGQHLAQQTIAKAVLAHMRNNSPKKALVISMHGWTGTGKNYLASLIVEAIYKKGMRSHFVHQFVSNLHFPHDDSIGIYKRQIRQWIRGNVTACERSVFIFDEVDKLTPTVLDAVKPFIDHFEVLDGVDFRKSIFLFLSNSGGEDISLRTLEHHDAGRSRESITLTEMEKLVTENAFNQPGGLKFSELISAQLIDHFVPFLPMERRHVRMCIRDYLQQRGYAVTEDRLMAIAETLQYYPASNPIFSVSGCKKIAQKAELHLMSEENPMRDPFGIEHHGDEHDRDEL